VAPGTVTVTALEKDGSPDTGSVVQGEALDVEDASQDQENHTCPERWG